MTDSDFLLNARLKQDTFFVRDMAVSTLLLMNNAHIPWVILVPKRDDVTSILDLSSVDYDILTSEIRHVAQLMQNLFNPERLNIASLGNVVSQMHWHIVCRFTDDICFPKPVWGNIPDMPYKAERANDIIQRIQDVLK